MQSNSDVARLFGYETKQINRQVLRNINRFPEKYCFRLTYDEYNFLRCQNVTLKNSRGEHRKYLPYVFTEYERKLLKKLDEYNIISNCNKNNIHKTLKKALN